MLTLGGISATFLYATGPMSLRLPGGSKGLSGHRAFQGHSYLGVSFLWGPSQPRVHFIGSLPPSLVFLPIAS